MFGIGFFEIVVLVIVALLVLGPDKLPELGKTLARLFGELRKVNREINRTIADVKSGAVESAVGSAEKTDGGSQDAASTTIREEPGK